MNEMPSIPARERNRHAYRDPQTHRFTKRPDSAVQRFIDNPRMDPHAVALLRDDTATTVTWDFTEQSTDMPKTPAPWQESAWRQDFETERQTWGPVVNWRSLAIGLVGVAVFVALYVAMP